eukprot:SAG11_NODE_588_length_8329_cov_18.642857_11_plen_376_part_00
MLCRVRWRRCSCAFTAHLGAEVWAQLLVGVALLDEGEVVGVQKALRLAVVRAVGRQGQRQGRLDPINSRRCTQPLPTRAHCAGVVHLALEELPLPFFGPSTRSGSARCCATASSTSGGGRQRTTASWRSSRCRSGRSPTSVTAQPRTATRTCQRQPTHVHMCPHMFGIGLRPRGSATRWRDAHRGGGSWQPAPHCARPSASPPAPVAPPDSPPPASFPALRRGIARMDNRNYAVRLRSGTAVSTESGSCGWWRRRRWCHRGRVGSRRRRRASPGAAACGAGRAAGRSGRTRSQHRCAWPNPPCSRERETIGGEGRSAQRRPRVKCCAQHLTRVWAQHLTLLGRRVGPALWLAADGWVRHVLAEDWLEQSPPRHRA